MTRQQRILITSLWMLVVIAMTGIVTTWATRNDDRASALPPTTFDVRPADETRLGDPFPAPSFSLTDQDGKPLRTEDLKGSVWTAMVFFTNCPGVCPMMTGKMGQLQKAVSDPRVKIVSLSIDPEKDTPDVLKQYAQRAGAQEGRWYFLTGPKDEMYDVAHAFKLAATPATDAQPIVHSNKVMLVDARGMVRNYYSTDSDTEMADLAKDAERLAQEK